MNRLVAQWTIRGHPWVVVMIVIGSLAAWMDLGTLHDFDNADSLLPVLVSTQRWTPFFWGQDRFGMLVPLVAMPIRDPLANLLVQGWISTTATLLAPFVVASFVTGRTGEWIAIGASTNLLCLLLTPPAVHLDWFVTQPYGLPISLGFTALIVADRRGHVRDILIAFILLALACWVNLGIAVLLALAAIAGGSRPTRLLTLVGSAATLGFLLSRYGASTHTNASLTPPARWASGWTRLFENSTGVFTSPRLAALVAIAAAAAAVWLWSAGRPLSSRRTAIILVMAAGPWFVVGTSAWVEQNGHVFRYMYPTLMIVGLGASTTFAALFAGRTNALSVGALVGLLAVAIVRSGTPSLRRIEHRLDDRMGAPVRAALQSGVTVIAGDYWRVWPGVFYANLLLVRAHSDARVFGLTYRSEATDPLWMGAGRPLLIASPPNDESVGTMVKQHGVAITLLAHSPGFDLYAGRYDPVSGNVAK